MKRKVRNTWKGLLQITIIAIAVFVFFMGLITVVDKLAYGAERFMNEVPTYSITISEVEYNIPTTVPNDFSSWPIRLQKLSNPEYGLIQWTNSETNIRFTVFIHIPTGSIKVATLGIQGIDATHWWIWKDEKVYEVDSETAIKYVRYYEKLRSV